MDLSWKSHFPKTLAYIFVDRGVKFDLATLLQRAQALLLLWACWSCRLSCLPADVSVWPRTRKMSATTLRALLGDRPLVVRAAVADVR